MIVSKICKNKIEFCVYLKNFVLSGISTIKQNHQCNRNISVSTSCNDQENEKLSTLTINGNRIKIAQHYFDQPVKQPRPPKGRRRIADLTGLKVWSTAVPFFQYLKAEAFPKCYKRYNLGNKNELNILELGSGTGILGICVAANGSKVVLTDPGICVNLSETESSNTIDHLRSNVECNKTAVEGRARVEKLLWGNLEEIDYIKRNNEPFNFIIGSDLLYEPLNYPDLLKTIQMLSQNTTVILLAHPIRHQGEKQFLKEASHIFHRVSCLTRGNINIFEFSHS